MKKLHTKYVCQACSYESARWTGKCPNCGAWNSFVEEIVSTKTQRKERAVLRGASAPVAIGDVKVVGEKRVNTGLPELDRVLGGGIVRGSVVLVGGDPGIGKSTLMLQTASLLASAVVLYITGEESVNQIKLRAERLNVEAAPNLLLLSETDLQVIEPLLEKTRPDIVIVDSIQTMYNPGLESAAGTVSQVREGASLFMRYAKQHAAAIFLIGHVTKEGVIAGPKVIEHMVDTVLQFEGERHYAYRIIRSLKNRFGSTNEIGIFEMHDGGLREVANPSEVFLAERKPDASGSAVVASMEGTRPLLLEVQALVAPTSYGMPQRTSTGFENRRLQMLLAVLEKRVGLRLGQYDIFVNVAGGVRVDEPAVDLGMAASIASSLHDRPVDPSTVAVGEIGLGGEIRSISQIEKRIAESEKMGFRRIIVPERNLKQSRKSDIEILEAGSVETAIEALLRS